MSRCLWRSASYFRRVAATFNYRSDWPDRVGPTTGEIRLIYFRARESWTSNLLCLTDGIISYNEIDAENPPKRDRPKHTIGIQCATLGYVCRGTCTRWEYVRDTTVLTGNWLWPRKRRDQTSCRTSRATVPIFHVFSSLFHVKQKAKTRGGKKREKTRSSREVKTRENLSIGTWRSIYGETRDCVLIFSLDKIDTGFAYRDNPYQIENQFFR